MGKLRRGWNVNGNGVVVDRLDMVMMAMEVVSAFSCVPAYVPAGSRNCLLRWSILWLLRWRVHTGRGWTWVRGRRGFGWALLYLFRGLLSSEEYESADQHHCSYCRHYS